MDAFVRTGRPQKNAPTERRFYFQMPNIILELDLTPHQLALYCAIRRTTDEAGRCFRSGANLASLCGMSTGSVSAAKRRLAQPFALLGSKPLVRIVLRPSLHGGKPCHHITPVNIWPENERHFRSPTSLGEGHAEVATSRDELATSPNETKKTQLRKTREENLTPSNPSSREEERGRAEEISKLWEFVCSIFKRTDGRSSTPRELKLMKSIVPAPEQEYALLTWWFSLDARNHAFSEGVGFYLRRRPKSAGQLLSKWSSVGDIARGFHKECDQKGTFI